MKFFYDLGSDIGKRKVNNQDKLLIRIGEAEGIGEFGLFVVADGMGGMAEGEKASEIAVEALKHWWEQLDFKNICHPDQTSIGNDLGKQFRHINSNIRHYGQELGIKLGTTLSALFIVRDTYVLCHIGDSRVYRLKSRDKQLIQLTIDHTVVAEQVRFGKITSEEALYHPNRNILTQCLGIRQEISPFLSWGKVEKGDIFLLCSDGLYNKVPHHCLATSIMENMPGAADRLIRIANDNGGNDNISVIIVWNEGYKNTCSSRMWNIFKTIFR